MIDFSLTDEQQPGRELAKIMQVYEATSQIQRLVIARETLMPRRVELTPQPERPAA